MLLILPIHIQSYTNRPPRLTYAFDDYRFEANRRCNYILSDDERNALLEKEPRADAYLHPYVGSGRIINGGKRWILALQNATPSDIRGIPKCQAD